MVSRIVLTATTDIRLSYAYLLERGIIVPHIVQTVWHAIVLGIASTAANLHRLHKAGPRVAFLVDGVNFPLSLSLSHNTPSTEIQGSVRTLKSPHGPRFDVEGGEVV